MPNPEQQTIKNAITGVAAKGDNVLESLGDSVKDLIEVLLRRSYAKNQSYKATQAAQPLIGSTIPDPTFARQVEAFEKQTQEVTAQNAAVSKVALQSAFQGRAIDPGLAGKIQKRQEKILDTVNQLNSVAQKVQFLMKQQAMILGDSKTADPKVAAKLDKALEEYSKLNKQFKDQVTKQASKVEEVKAQPMSPRRP